MSKVLKTKDLKTKVSKPEMSKEMLKEEMLGAYLSVVMELYMKDNASRIAERLIADMGSAESRNNMIKLGLTLELKGKSFEFVQDIVSGKENIQKVHEKMMEKFKGIAKN